MTDYQAEVDRLREWTAEQQTMLEHEHDARMEAEANVEHLRAELSALRGDAAEWLCVSCNQIHPSQRPDCFMQLCPQCGLAMSPTNQNLRKIEALWAELACNAAMLARQCDLARDAEARAQSARAKAIGECVKECCDWARVWDAAIARKRDTAMFLADRICALAAPKPGESHE